MPLAIHQPTCFGTNNARKVTVTISAHLCSIITLSTPSHRTDPPSLSPPPLCHTHHQSPSAGTMSVRQTTMMKSRISCSTARLAFILPAHGRRAGRAARPVRRASAPATRGRPVSRAEPPEPPSRAPLREHCWTSGTCGAAEPSLDEPSRAGPGRVGPTGWWRRKPR